MTISGIYLKTPVALSQTGGCSNHHQRFAYRKISSIGKLETQSVGIKTRMPHHRSPGGVRRRKKRSTSKG